MTKLEAVRKGVFLGLVLMASAAITACGGGDGDASTTSPGSTSSPGSASASTPSTSTPSTATRPSISGTPVTRVQAGAAYSFTPTVQSAGGAVSFSISNKPAWASFSTVTGALTGTPGPGDVGTFPNIVITANNAAGSAALPAFSIEVSSPAVANKSMSATLLWQPPTENVDGTPVSNLAGYNIYVGPSPDELTTKITVTNPGLTAYTIADLSAGTYYFGISAYTTDGVESEIAVAGSKTIG